LSNQTGAEGRASIEARSDFEAVHHSNHVEFLDGDERPTGRRRRVDRRQDFPDGHRESRINADESELGTCKDREIMRSDSRGSGFSTGLKWSFIAAT